MYSPILGKYLLSDIIYPAERGCSRYTREQIIFQSAVSPLGIFGLEHGTREQKPDLGEAYWDKGAKT